MKYIFLSIILLTSSFVDARDGRDSSFNKENAEARNHKSDDVKFDEFKRSKSGNKNIRDFDQAKKYISEVFSHDMKTIYCGCDIVGKKVDFKSCGYLPPKNNSRSGKMEVEHSFPAENVGRFLSSWRDGHPSCVDKKGKRYKGRKCSEKVSPFFQQVTGDLYGLYPEDGLLNQIRSNHNYMQLTSSEYNFGKCSSKFENKKFDPGSPSNRAQVARSVLYVHLTYGIHISDQQKKLMTAWNNSSPPSRSECTRWEKIKKIQGNENIFYYLCK